MKNQFNTVSRFLQSSLAILAIAFAVNQASAASTQTTDATGAVQADTHFIYPGIGIGDDSLTTTATNSDASRDASFIYPGIGIGDDSFIYPGIGIGDDS